MDAFRTEASGQQGDRRLMSLPKSLVKKVRRLESLAYSQWQLPKESIRLLLEADRLQQDVRRTMDGRRVEVRGLHQRLTAVKEALTKHLSKT